MVEDKYKTYVRKGAFVFFDIKGSKVPFQVSGIEDSVHFILSLQNINNKKDSDLLSGLDLWIPLDAIKPRHQRSPKNLQDKWDEYRIIDDANGNEYDILRVEEFPQQLMAIIKVDSKESLIPLSDQLISSLDKENRIIRMKIPDGLLDL